MSMARKNSFFSFRSLLIVAWIMCGILVLPALVAIPVSLTPKRFLSLPSGELSLQHYTTLFTSDLWVGSAWQSLVIATSSMVLATGLGTLCAVGLWRVSSRFSELLRVVLLLPLIIPPIISAMAFYRTWVKLELIDTYAGMIVAHAILSSPMVMISVSAALANFDVRLEQASRNLGASVTTTLWRVIIPAIKPGIFSGAIFAFILSWDETVVALFISKFDIYTLPRRMWDGIRENTDPAVAAAAVVTISITLIAMLLAFWISKRSARHLESA